jgi:hypothetical protein
LGLCTNSTGTDKLTPLVIGKFKSPRCLKSVNLRNVGVSYKNSKKAWMNSIIFQEWITTFDKIIRLENQNRKVLLLLDNVSSHTIYGLDLKNVEILFLPKYTTLKLQPLDAGIIASFKRKYRALFVQYLIHELEQNSITKPKLNILGSMRFIVESWDKVTPKTIQNCWFHTGLIIRDSAEESGISNVLEESEENLSIQNTISQLNLSDAMSAEEYVNFPEERIIENSLDECSLIDMTEENECEEDDSIPETKVSHKDALNSCEILLKYLEQQSDDYSSHVKLLNNLKMKVHKVKDNSLKQALILDYFNK